MNIPKSYEAFAADLASEKIISKTLLGQKEAYMMLADKGRLDLATCKQKACEAAEREAALREELSGSNRRLGACINQIEEQQQRLTVAEQLLSRALQYGGMTPDWRDSVEEALKTDADCERGYSNQTGCPVCQGIKP